MIRTYRHHNARLRVIDVSMILLRIIAMILVLSAPAGAAITDMTADGGLSGAWFIENNEMDRVDAYLIIKSGEFEVEGTEGMNHYLEHQVWQHAIGGQAEQKLGRDTNAYTTGDSVIYFLAGEVNSLAENLGVLTRVFETPRLDRKFMLEERDIVHQEYQIKYTEWPWMEASSDFETALYGPGFRSRSIIGRSEDILNFNPDEALNLHSQTYIPSNAALVIIGNTSAESVRSLYKKYFAKFNNSNVYQAPSFESFSNDRTTLVSAVNKIPVQRFIFAKRIKLPQALPKVRLFLISNILTDILQSTRPGSLTKPMQYDSFTASWIDVSIDVVSDDEITLRFSAEPDINISLVQLESIFEQEIQNLAKSGMPASTFQKVLSQSRKALERLETKRSRQLNLAITSINLGASPLSLEQLDLLMSDIKKSEIDALLKAFAGTGRTVIMYANRKETQ